MNLSTNEETLRVWLDAHGPLTDIEHHVYNSDLPLRVVSAKHLWPDGDQMPVLKLVRPTDWNFVTISHHWGNNPEWSDLKHPFPNETKKVKVKAVQKRSLYTVAALCRHLNVDYFWLDCLCIDQDSLAEKQREIVRMGSFYERSAYTLAFPYGIDTVGPPFKVMDDELTLPVWHTRAWTLQEEIKAGDKIRYVYYMGPYGDYNKTVLPTESSDDRDQDKREKQTPTPFLPDIVTNFYIDDFPVKEIVGYSSEEDEEEILLNKDVIFSDIIFPKEEQLQYTRKLADFKIRSNPTDSENPSRRHLHLVQMKHLQVYMLSLQKHLDSVHTQLFIRTSQRKWSFWSVIRELYRRNAHHEEDYIYSALSLLGINISATSIFYGIGVHTAFERVLETMDPHQRLLFTVVEAYRKNPMVDGYSILPSFCENEDTEFAPMFDHLRMLGTAEYISKQGMMVTAPCITVNYTATSGYYPVRTDESSVCPSVLDEENDKKEVVEELHESLQLLKDGGQTKDTEGEFDDKKEVVEELHENLQLLKDGGKTEDTKEENRKKKAAERLHENLQLLKDGGKPEGTEDEFDYDLQEKVLCEVMEPDGWLHPGRFSQTDSTDNLSGNCLSKISPFASRLNLEVIAVSEIKDFFGDEYLLDQRDEKLSQSKRTVKFFCLVCCDAGSVKQKVGVAVVCATKFRWKMKRFMVA